MISFFKKIIFCVFLLGGRPPDQTGQLIKAALKTHGVLLSLACFSFSKSMGRNSSLIDLPAPSFLEAPTTYRPPFTPPTDTEFSYPTTHKLADLSGSTRDRRIYRIAFSNATPLKLIAFYPASPTDAALSFYFHTHKSAPSDRLLFFNESHVLVSKERPFCPDKRALLVSSYKIPALLPEEEALNNLYQANLGVDQATACWFTEPLDPLLMRLKSRLKEVGALIAHRLVWVQLGRKRYLSGALVIQPHSSEARFLFCNLLIEAAFFLCQTTHTKGAWQLLSHLVIQDGTNCGVAAHGLLKTDWQLYYYCWDMINAQLRYSQITTAHPFRLQGHLPWDARHNLLCIKPTGDNFGVMLYRMNVANQQASKLCTLKHPRLPIDFLTMQQVGRHWYLIGGLDGKLLLAQLTIQNKRCSVDWAVQWPIRYSKGIRTWPDPFSPHILRLSIPEQAAVYWGYFYLRNGSNHYTTGQSVTILVDPFPHSHPLKTQRNTSLRFHFQRLFPHRLLKKTPAFRQSDQPITSSKAL